MDTEKAIAERDAEITDILYDGDESFDIVIRRDEKGGVSYIDPVLATLSKQRMELEAMQQQITRQLRTIGLREQRRLKALNALGSLTDYPTEKQRRFLKVFEQAAELRNAAMLQMAFNICLEAECERTNWKSKAGEPLVTCFARLMTELAE